MRALLAGSLVLVTGCSWSRFDELEDDAPVVLLDEPGGMGHGFGSSVASIGTADDAHAFVAAARGQRGAAEYRIGFGQSPGIDANDAGHCRSDCTLASRVAGLANAATSAGPRQRCWASGVNAAPELVLRCDDGAPNPDHVRSIPAGITIGEPDRLVLASDPEAAPALAAATTAGAGAAWFYPPDGLAPVDLVPPAAESGFGASLAVARGSTGRIYAVGAPDAGRVWLFHASSDDQSVASLGCVSGGPGFGRTLAAGDVDGASGDELVVAEETDVVVLDDLAALAAGGACTASPPVVVRLACTSTADVSGCGPASGFGDALAVADLNGDANGEVVVGAPGMSARGESRAGAILIYDVDLSGETQPEWLTDAKFISSAGSGDALGSALAAIRQHPAGQNPRDVLLAGAPGGDKAAIFYCFELPSGERGSRCE